jgi:hypothetical protein
MLQKKSLSHEAVSEEDEIQLLGSEDIDIHPHRPGVT